MTDQNADLKPLVSELAGDEDMAELVEMYIAELPERAAALEQSLAEQDWVALARLAHQIKGAAGGYGFPTLTIAAGELETTANAEDDLDALAQHVREISDLCGRASARSEDA